MKDIDECKIKTDNCSSKALCTNNFGSFKCSCLPGYTGDGVICTDVNECELMLDDCAWNKICRNKIGSYECVCQEGFNNIQNDCIGNFVCFLTFRLLVVLLGVVYDLKK